MGYEYEVRKRLFLTSNKRVVVPEGDRLAAFLLAPPGPVDPVKVKEIRSYRNGANYLHKISSRKAGKPEGDTATEPGADKSREPGDDKAGEPEGDTSGQPGEDKGDIGPDSVVSFGIHEGKAVRDLPEKYLANLVRVSTQHRPMAEAELARRTAEAEETGQPLRTEGAE